MHGKVKYGYENPKAPGVKTNSYFSLSLEKNVYVNCFTRCDLITICDLQGNLKYNIYGPGWFDNESDKKTYFFGVDILDDRIIASYINDSRIVVKGGIEMGNSPTKFLMFDINGNYLKTIDIGSEFTRFCVDQENKRLIMCFMDRPEIMGYVDTSDIL